MRLMSAHGPFSFFMLESGKELRAEAKLMANCLHNTEYRNKYSARVQDDTYYIVSVRIGEEHPFADVEVHKRKIRTFLGFGNDRITIAKQGILSPFGRALMEFAVAHELVIDGVTPRGRDTLAERFMELLPHQREFVQAMQRHVERNGVLYGNPFAEGIVGRRADLLVGDFADIERRAMAHISREEFIALHMNQPMPPMFDPEPGERIEYTENIDVHGRRTVRMERSFEPGPDGPTSREVDSSSWTGRRPRRER